MLRELSHGIHKAYRIIVFPINKHLYFGGSNDIGEMRNYIAQWSQLSSVKSCSREQTKTRTNQPEREQEQFGNNFYMYTTSLTVLIECYIVITNNLTQHKSHSTNRPGRRSTVQ